MINLKNYNKIRTKSMTMQKLRHVQKKSAFLLKTYEILENKKYEDIVTWHHDGIGFVIIDIDKFTSTILPLYFKHSNFASYIRQLNMYGFSKKRSAKSENYYHHAKFQRNQKQLIRQIQRKTQKKQSKAQTKNKQGNQDVKICSELSIQLQSQFLSNRKIQHPDNPQRTIQQKYQQLTNTNESLINIQLSSILQILGDMQQLRNTNIDQSQRDDIKNTLTEYIQIQFSFLNQLKQKSMAESKNLKSLTVLATEESLKQRKQMKRQKGSQKSSSSPVVEDKEGQESCQ